METYIHTHNKDLKCILATYTLISNSAQQCSSPIELLVHILMLMLIRAMSALEEVEDGYEAKYKRWRDRKTNRIKEAIAAQETHVEEYRLDPDASPYRLGVMERFLEPWNAKCIVVCSNACIV